jgi:hypothetical protein
MRWSWLLAGYGVNLTVPFIILLLYIKIVTFSVLTVDRVEDVLFKDQRSSPIDKGATGLKAVCSWEVLNGVVCELHWYQRKFCAGFNACFSSSHQSQNATTIERWLKLFPVLCNPKTSHLTLPSPLPYQQYIVPSAEVGVVYTRVVQTPKAAFANSVSASLSHSFTQIVKAKLESQKQEDLSQG